MSFFAVKSVIISVCSLLNGGGYFAGLYMHHLNQKSNAHYAFNQTNNKPTSGTTCLPESLILVCLFTHLLCIGPSTDASPCMPEHWGGCSSGSP